jgi:hypothetical protein
MTTDEAASADGNELTDNEIDAMERMLNMRLQLEKKRLRRKIRRKAREEANG